MIKCILIIALSIFFYSCRETMPSGIIKQTKMQEVLWDVLRANALSEQFVKSDSTKSLDSEKARLIKEVFVIHNITEEQYQKSYAYYTQHPDVMRTMLDSMYAQKARSRILEIPVK